MTLFTLQHGLIRYEDNQHGNLKSSMSGGIELLLRTKTGLIHSRVIKNALDKGRKPTGSLNHLFLSNLVSYVSPSSFIGH